MRWFLIGMSMALVCWLHAQRTEGPYRLQADDVITISVDGFPELFQRGIVVRRDGTISFSPIGTLQAQGLTPDELADRIARELVRMQYLTRARVVVNIEQYHRPRVSVLGFVNRPGVYEFKDGDRLLNALSYAGGPVVERARLEDSWLQRIDGTKIALNLRRLYEEGDLSLDIPLQDGDTIFIPEETENRYFVGGQVKRPGLYTWRPRLTVLDALSQAGWETERAALSRTYVIRKNSEGKEDQIQVDLVKLLRKGDMSQNIALQPGDMIYVSETRTPNIDQTYRALSLVWLLRNLGILNSLWRP
jgi:polysaccharide export outer membrane protein